MSLAKALRREGFKKTNLFRTWCLCALARGISEDVREPRKFLGLAMQSTQKGIGTVGATPCGCPSDAVAISGGNSQEEICASLANLQTP